MQTAASEALRWRKTRLFLMQERPAVRGVQAVRYWPLVVSVGITTAGSHADVEAVVIFSTWPLE